VLHYSKKFSHFFLIFSILLLAANLRPAITSVGPLIRDIRIDMHLSNGLTGFLTTLPLLAFALFSPLAPRIALRFGTSRTMFAGLMVLIIGLLIRSSFGIITLWIGTVLIGMAIANINVLLPGLIKQQFPYQIGLMTGLYTTTMALFASLASGLGNPISSVLGWRVALACWLFLTVFASLAWIPQLSQPKKSPSVDDGHPSFVTLLYSPLTWQVTIFFGLQCFIFYIIVAWLPEILQDKGVRASTAGWMLSFYQFAGIPFNLTVPILADRMQNQRPLVIGIGIGSVIGVLGLIIGRSPVFLAIWSIILGMSLGACISLALAFIGLRAANEQQTETLSGVVQSVGYLLAAVGPILFGFLKDLFHTWTIPLILLVCVTILLVISGLGAGRNRHITVYEISSTE